MAAKTTNTNPRKDEANETPAGIEFEFDGVTYTIDSEAVDNLELFEAMEDENYVTAVRGFVGRDGWQAFKDSQRTETGRVPMARFEGFLTTMMEAMGSGN